MKVKTESEVAQLCPTPSDPMDCSLPGKSTGVGCHCLLCLTEAEDIKKSWQGYREELYKKDLNDSDNHDDVITHLEPDILECKVKWA